MPTAVLPTSLRGFLVAAAALAAAPAWWALVLVVPPAQQLAASDLGITLSWIAAAGATASARAATPAGSARPLWGWLFAGSALMLAGQLGRDALDLAGGAANVTAPFGLLFYAGLGAFIAAGVAAVSMRSRGALLLVGLDVAAMVPATLALGALVVGDLLVAAASVRGFVQVAAALMLPGVALAMTALTLGLYMSAPDARWRPALAWLVGCGLCGVGASIGWLAMVVRNAREPGSLYDLFALGLGACLVVAALQWRRDARLPAQPLTDRAAVPHPLLSAVIAVVVSGVLLAASREPAAAAAGVAVALCAVALLLIAARTTVVILQHRALATVAERAVAQFQTLYEVGLSTASLTEVEAIVRQVVDHATELTACDGAMLALDVPGQGFVIRAQRKPDHLPEKIGQPLAGISLEAIETGEMVVAERYSEHPSSNPQFDDTVASAIAVPLIAHGRLVGTLTVYSRAPRRFGETTRRFLRLYAAQASVGIANAQMLGESRRLASDDPLTGLFNRRFLMERLESEVAEATRFGDSFCVVLCDIDGLKALNDSAGHLAGDDVLRLTAKGLSGSVRATDVVARIGGDEFVLLLPRTPRDQGRALVDRVAARLGDESYFWAGRERPLPRVSFGVASFPADGITAGTLLAAADARMYEDKSRARRAPGGAAGAE